MLKLHEEAISHALATVREEDFGWYPCGFVWVRTKGNTKFARALRGIFTKNAYWGGVEFSMSRVTRSQSMDYKTQLARAYIAFMTDNGVEGLSIRSNID